MFPADMRKPYSSGSEPFFAYDPLKQRNVYSQPLVTACICLLVLNS